MQLKLLPLTKRVLFHVITVLFSLMLIIVRKFSKDQVKKKKRSLWLMGVLGFQTEMFPV